MTMMMVAMKVPPNALFYQTPSSSTAAAAAAAATTTTKARQRHSETLLLPSPRQITTNNTRRNNSSRARARPRKVVPPKQRPQAQPQRQPLRQPLQQHQQQEQQHRALAVENFHRNQRLLAVLNKLRSKQGSDPTQILLASEGGDWSKEEFWAVVRFLDQTSRLRDAISVFDLWKKIEKSRINEANYAKVIELLCKSAMMAEAISLHEEMKVYGLIPSVAIYNSLIHGFAKKGEFDSAKKFLTDMVENGLTPEIETYNGLIQAYGNHRMYDEMCKCVKKMELEGLFPNHVTYNILITVFARGGLLEKMEGVYRTILSKGMGLQSLTSIAMLEAYADLGILENMENVYRRILSSRTNLEEGLIRKMARVYIERYRFSRLEELALDIASKTGRTYLVWCLALLSSACLVSRRGMESVTHEMKVAKVRPHVTFTNILALCYLKMKDLRNLDAALSQLLMQKLKPDIVTIGVAFDANIGGVGGTKAIEVWRRMGYLEEEVEMKTDPLVLTAFGKGYFLRSCEELYLSLGLKAAEKKVWTYNDIIDLVMKKMK